MNRLTAHQGLAFEDFCWQTQVLVLLIYMCRRVWGMIPQDGSSKNVLRCPEDSFFKFFGDSGARTLFLVSKGDCVSHSPAAPLIPQHQIQLSLTCSTFSAQMAETGLGALGCSNRISMWKDKPEF